MKLLIIGATGMLGHKLLLKLSKHHQVTGTIRGESPEFLKPFSHENLEIRTGVDAYDLKSVEDVIKDIRPDAVLNCVGIVKQLKEAKDPVVSITINALFPHQLAQLCARHSSRLIHFSTDCVFSGNKGPYSESDPSDVNDIYGMTKFLGEVDQDHALTIRTSIVGREFTKPTGLVEWFLSQRGGQVKGFKNALYTGLTTNAMADVVDLVLTRFPNLNGVYQVASDSISKFDLLDIINRVAGTRTTIDSDVDFFCDRRLGAAKFHNATGWRAESWEKMIITMFAEDELYYKPYDK
jgi:dTDP-4-dehydrorhamnose reductase